jgi:type II secretory pathway component PulC
MADRPAAGRGSAKVEVPPLNFFAPILGRNVFKAAVDTGPEQGAPGEKVDLAKLKAVLLGTMSSDIPSLSRAVVMENNVQRLIRPGDTLEGTRVAEIRRRAVVVEAGGKRQLLVLDAGADAAETIGNFGPTELSISEVKQALQDIPALAGSIRFALAEHDEERRLWVRQIRPDSLFGKAGLKKGDIIMRVGGQEVNLDTRPEDLFNLLERDRVDVDLVRDGSPLTLSLAWTK